MKYSQLYVPKNIEGNYYDFIELPNGQIRKLTDQERNNPALVPVGSMVFASDQLTSQGTTASGSGPVEFQGEVFPCPSGLHWKTTPEGIKKLGWAKRIFVRGSRLRYKRASSDFVMASISNVWTGTQLGSSEKLYVVQTAVNTVERCLLMTTDPGDLVFDPTCVRKGTRVWCVRDGGSPPIVPPHAGGRSLPACLSITHKCLGDCRACYA